MVGIALLVLGAHVPFFGQQFIPNARNSELWIDAAASVIFGGVLLYWAFSNEEPRGPSFVHPFGTDTNWGIGNPTVTMVVGVVTAVIAVFSFAHELFK